MRNSTNARLVAASAITLLAALASGCTALDTQPAWGPHCPEPEQKDGYLIMEKGKTRKCHILAYSRNNCRSITDSTNANGLVCGYAHGTTLYLFDKQDILQNHRTFTRQAPVGPK